MKPYVIALVGWLSAIVPVVAKSLTLSGTDFFKGDIAASMEAAGADHGLKATWSGSFQALQALRSGKVDMAVLTSPSPEELPDVPGMRRLPLAYRLCRVVVAKDNPVNSITYKQLRAIYGSRVSQRLENWKDVLGAGNAAAASWANRAIEPMIPIAYTSFSREIFLHNALRDDRLHPSVKVYANEHALQNAFAANSGAIAILSGLAVEDFAKPIPVAKEEGQSFTATPENLYFGDYPLYMPFSLYFPEIRTKELLPLIEAFYSADVAKVIFDNGLAPVPDAFRAAEINRLKQGF